MLKLFSRREKIFSSPRWGRKKDSLIGIFALCHIMRRILRKGKSCRGLFFGNFEIFLELFVEFLGGKDFLEG